MTEPTARDARYRAAARVAVGAIFLLRTTGLGGLTGTALDFGASPLLGWPDGRFHASVHGLALPDATVAVLAIVRTCAAVAFTFGAKARAAGVVAAVTGYAVLAQDVLSVSTSIHVLFVAVAALALTDATSVWAVVPDPPRGSGERPFTLVVASIYLWSAAAKLQSEWLSGHALASFLDASAFHGPAAVLLAGAGARLVCAWVVVGLEIAIGVLLAISPRTRRVGVALGLAFHACAEVTVRPDVLGWTMASLLVACWSTRACLAAGRPCRPRS